jgi:hypothetical protein
VSEPIEDLVEGTLDASGEHITALLDGIQGAFERAEEALGQARRGEGVALDDLA